MNTDYMDACTCHVYLTSVEWAPLFQDLKSSRAIMRENHTQELRITLRNSGVSEIAMEQKRGLPQNLTSIHLLLFNSPV